jgi:hypothetical protein
VNKALDWVVALAPFVVLAGLAWHAYRKQHPAVYRCRVNRCGRVFADRDSRALHFRRTHLS